MQDISPQEMQKFEDQLNQLRSDRSPIKNLNAYAEMPKYICHKTVWALKITEVVLDSTLAQKENRETTGGAFLTPDDGRYGQITVDHEYIRKHNPEAGGYYVVYEDGYKSFSPAEAFEKGYTLIP